MVDYTKRPKSGGGVVPPAAGGPISLTKRGQTVSLTKGAAAGGSGPIRVNLNWEQRAAAPEGKGFMKKLKAAATPPLDLDLGCLWELTDGTKGVVQALGNVFGSLDAPPYIQLDKDDRAGTSSDGENLLVNGKHAAQIKRLAVFAFIYQGAPNWSQAGGVVTIHPPAGEPVTIQLDETTDGKGMCGVCLITGDAGGFEVERLVQYVSRHSELDEMLGWGLNWRAGRK